MGLRERLARRGARAAHVLVVEAPGAWLVRVRLEQQVREKGWQLALSPADADVLAVCGMPGPALEEAVSNLWDLLPGPRARATLDSADPGFVSEQLSRAEQALLDVQRQHDDSRARSTSPEAEQQDGGHGEMDHADEHEGMDHGDAHQGMDHGDEHQGMDHGGMDMAPGGIPLAQGGEDRDGLEMDLLHVPLGPVLPYWPAGLVVRCSLQGDVITAAEVERIDGSGEPEHHAHPGPESRATAQPLDRLPGAAVRCDNASRLLMLAGWDDAGAQARRVRDLLLSDIDPAQAGRALARLRRRVAGSLLLRWALRDVGRLAQADLERLGLPERLRGDTRDRLLSILDRAAAELDASGGSSAEAPAGEEAVDLGVVARLVTGLDLATARLVVASLDLDPLQPVREAAHA